MATRKRYSKQFKLQAVELLEQSDKPAADVARELGGIIRGQTMVSSRLLVHY